MGKKGLKNILSRKGESLILVLILMFFFMIVCVSVSSAALSGIRYSGMQRDFNQVLLLERSVHENIMFSLQSGALGFHIIDDIRNTGASSPPFNLNITVADPALQNFMDNHKITVQGITITLTEQKIVPGGAVGAVIDREEIPTFCTFEQLCLEINLSCSESACSYLCIFEGIGAHDHAIHPCHRLCSTHHTCNVDDTAPYWISNCNPDPSAVPIHECLAGPLHYLDPNETSVDTRIVETFSHPRIPYSSIIIASLEVLVEIDVDGIRSFSRSFFSYSGGEMTDCIERDGECINPVPVPGVDPHTDPECCMKEGDFTTGVMSFVGGLSGSWRFDNYDTVLM
ncbi:MAG: hypothetical protein FWD48_08010 [Oscillospiraceae bacterium]|nr:hypothetical protein [Oscillospiraceae bacterium]